MKEERPTITPYYEALGVTQAQYEIMLKFREAYWKAFLKPDFETLREEFDRRFTPDELDQMKHCILFHTSIGSTPSKTLAPYVFDINGKFQAWIPELEELGKQ